MTFKYRETKQSNHFVVRRISQTLTEKLKGLENRFLPYAFNFLIPVSLLCFFFFFSLPQSHNFWQILLSDGVTMTFILRTSPFRMFLCVVSLLGEQIMPASKTESHLVTKYTDSLNEVVDLFCRESTDEGLLGFSL